RLMQSLDGELRRRVARERRGGDVATDRGHGDDAAALPLAHGGQHRLDAADDTEVVGLHDGAEVGEGELLDNSGPLDTGIVHQHIDGAELLHGSRNALDDRGVAVHVEGEDGEWETLMA